MDRPAIDVDKIQEQLLKKCRFQIITFLCLGIIYARGAWNVFGVLFLAAEVGHSCDANREYVTSGTVFRHNLSTNSTFSIMSLESHESDDEFFIRECDILVSQGNGTNVTKPCTFGWVYRSEVESTIVSEWDLVCVRAYLSELSTTVYMVGSMVGALLITPLADKFGRRLVLMVCLVAQAGLGVCVSLSVNYAMFTALRFIVGFLNMGIALITYVMMTETFPAKHRTIPCCGFQIFWAFGIMLTALFGFLVPNWRHLQLVFSLPNLLCACLVWFLPESLPWLISQNRLSQAKVVIDRIARFNGLCQLADLHVPETSPLNGDSGHNNNRSCESTHCYDEHIPQSDVLFQKEDVLSHNELLGEGTVSSRVGYEGPAKNGLNRGNWHEPVLHLKNSSNSSVDSEGQVTIDKNSPQKTTKDHANGLDSVFALCHSSRICVYSVIIFYLFFVNSLSYFGISLSTPVLHGNQFLNLFLLGAVEIPAYFICVIVCQRFGRKAPLCVFLLLCGAMNFTAILISDDSSRALSAVRIVFVMVGKFAITGSYTTVYLYSAEIFPTSVRNHSIGISSFFENLGFVAAPFIVFSARSIPELPMILFGVVSIIGGAMVTLMPETRNRPLPQTIEEVESWAICHSRSVREVVS